MTDSSIQARQEDLVREEEINQRLCFLNDSIDRNGMPATEADWVALRAIKMEQRTLRGELLALIGNERCGIPKYLRLVRITPEQFRAQFEMHAGGR